MYYTRGGACKSKNVIQQIQSPFTTTDMFEFLYQDSDSLYVLVNEDIVALEIPVYDWLIPTVQVQHTLGNVHPQSEPRSMGKGHAPIVQHLAEATAGAELAHYPDCLQWRPSRPSSTPSKKDNRLDVSGICRYI